MRLQFDFRLKNLSISKEIHRINLSLIKYALSTNDQPLFNELYGDKNSNLKPFTGSCYLPIKSYEDECILLKEPRMSLYLSSPEIELGICLYNAFQKLLKKRIKIKDQEVILEEIKMLQEKPMNERSIVIKMLSPILVRREDYKDLYLTAQDNFFKLRLEEIITNQITVLKPELSKFLTDNPIEIQPIQPRKVVIKNYDQYIDGNLGYYLLSSHPKVLNYLYQSGIGSRRSMGFGMFDVKEVRE